MFLELQTPWKPFGNNYHSIVITEKNLLRIRCQCAHKEQQKKISVPPAQQMTIAWGWPDNNDLALSGHRRQSIFCQAQAIVIYYPVPCDNDGLTTTAWRRRPDDDGLTTTTILGYDKFSPCISLAKRKEIVWTIMIVWSIGALPLRLAASNIGSCIAKETSKSAQTTAGRRRNSESRLYRSRLTNHNWGLTL